MKIKFINEGLPPDFDFNKQNNSISGVESDVINHNKPKNILQKVVKFNQKDIGKETNKTIYNGIEAWDKENLTQEFRSVLFSRISEKGWDKNDPFIQWLIATEDNNIKALDSQSAKVLIGHLDEEAFQPTDKYVTQDNNLFSGNSQDIIYKLNALSMLLDQSTARKYKDSNGKIPTVDLMLEEDKETFKDTAKIKSALSSFQAGKGEKSLISFKNWVQEIAKWNPKDIYKNIIGFLDDPKNKEITDKKEKDNFKIYLKEIFSEGNERKREEFFLGCKISKKTTPDDINDVLKAIDIYSKNNKDLISNSSTGDTFLKPGSMITIEQALKAKGKTGKTGYHFLGSYITKMKDTENKSKYIKILQKIYSNNKFYNDFLKYKIKISKDGSIPWTKTLKSYMDGIYQDSLEQNT